MEVVIFSLGFVLQFKQLIETLLPDFPALDYI
jgi:hypothetical protein